MNDIFISYSRVERSRAELLARAFQELGFSVWWDPQISAGEKWANEIEKALNDSKCVVVLWSENSVASDWVNDEAAYGRELNKLLPVMIEDVKVPIGFRALKSIVLTDWNGEKSHPGFLELVEAIKIIHKGQA